MQRRKDLPTLLGAAGMFKRSTTTYMVPPPYRNAVPALIHVLGSQLDFKFAPGIGLQHARFGALIKAQGIKPD